jgi:hypothetical protein
MRRGGRGAGTDSAPPERERDRKLEGGREKERDRER